MPIMRAKTYGLTAGVTGGARDPRAGMRPPGRVGMIGVPAEAITEAAVPDPAPKVGAADREAEIGLAALIGLLVDGVNCASPCRAGNPRRPCRRSPCPSSLMTRGWNRWRVRSR
jgi:hypothetical protein